MNAPAPKPASDRDLQRHLDAVANKSVASLRLVLFLMRRA